MKNNSGHKKTFIKILFVFATLLIIQSCETNPPTTVDFGTGKIFLTIKLDQNVASANKIVLLEDFANVSCVPCVQSNKIIETLTRTTYGPAKLVAVKFPTNFPSPSDPFYLARPDYCDQRMSYYNIFFAPTTIIDGTLRPISTDSIAIKNAIDQKLAEEARFEIVVTDSASTENYFVTVNLRFVNTTGLNLDETVMHTVITETDIEFEQPPGSNGETKFYDVMRDMLPTNSGKTLATIIAEGEVNYEFEEAIGSNWNINHLNTVVYIQNVNTKEVYQAGSTF
jgi:hypothetical protein